MTPIDQIRKALEAWEANKQPSTDAALLRALSPDAIKAVLASHDAAVQRAAEMQERCAQVADKSADRWPLESRSAREAAFAIRAIKE